MPSDSAKSQVLELARQLENAVETARLFGEDDFQRSVPAPSSVIEKTVPSVQKLVQNKILTDEPKIVRAAASAAPAPADSPSRVLAPGLEGKKKRLEELYKKYDGCQMCPLGATRSKIVFGVGSVDLKALFIGEGPGYDEDRQGFPFVGKAGQLLDKILQSIGLDRKTNVYIANTVKCHPMKDPAHPEMRGNDRAPLPSEILACKEILDEQIEILDPPVICVLGATAARAMLNSTEGITTMRGKLFDYRFPKSGKTVPLLPTYHPAALLRNELLKKDVWTDMKLLRTLLK